MTRIAALTLATVLTIHANASARPVNSAPVVNINTATVAQLALLPGIGAKTAAAIHAYAESGDASCDHRCHFKSVDDLLNVKGIGPKKLEAMRPYVTLEGATTATAKIRAAKGGAK